MVATEERVMTLLAQANPVPDVDALHLTEMEGSRYLAAIDQRSTDVLDIDSRHENTPQKARDPWGRWSLVAAGIVMLGTLGLFILDGREGNVATGVAVAEQFAEAVSSGTPDLDGLVTDDATFGPMTVPLDDDLAGFWAGLDSELTLSSCEQTSQVVRCDYEWSDVIRRAQDRPEYGTLTFLIENSSIANIARDWDQDASQWIDQGDPVIHYLQWLNENHPDWDDGLTWIGEPAVIGEGYAPLAHDDPVHNAAYAAALTRHLSEYESQLASGEIDLPLP